jgi:L-iditol 2-dehydrogenase
VEHAARRRGESAPQMTVAARNRAAVLHAPFDVRIEERPMPELGHEDVLVEVRAVGVCGSDVHYYEHGRVGSYRVEAPLVLGHETSGVVVALGRNVDSLTLGQRVALEPGVPCGRCRECRTGRYNLCPLMRFFGTPPVDGAFMQYVAIHADFAHLLPDNLSDEAGALVEPLAVAVWACQKGGVGPGQDVLVTGAGPVGQLAAQAAIALGANAPTVTDVLEERLRGLASRGVRVVDVSKTSLRTIGSEFDVLLECSGSEDALVEGIDCLRAGGVCVCVGMGPKESMTIPLARIQNRELLLTGTFRYANTYPAAIALAASGRVDLATLVTSRHPLDETQMALRVTSSARAMKAVVLPGSSASG